MRTRTTRRPVRRRPTRLSFEALEQRRVLTSGIGIFESASSTFRLRNEASAGPADAGEFQFSAQGTVPVIGDWNGDGQDDFGIFEPSTATWSLRYGPEAGDANAGIFTFGNAGAIPVVGDWNGDGRDDIGTFQSGTWNLRLGASPGLANAGSFQFGASDGQPVAGDWDGDGTDGIGVYNSQTGTWSLLQTAAPDATAIADFQFGPTGGQGVVGDWDGDGIDGIGVFQSANATWNLRQTASAGAADAGTFSFGTAGAVAVTGQFTAPAAPANALATVVLPPINLDLLGVEVRTSPISVIVSTNQGDGQLLGNLLTTVSTLIDLNGVSQALNTVLDSTVDLLNSADLNIVGAGSGPLDSAAASNTQVLELFVAPVHLDLLGVVVDTSTIRVTITTKSGEGLVLGNALTELLNLFNPPLPEELDIDYLNQKLDELLAKLDEQLPNIAAAPVPAVPISEGQILNVTVPPLDLDLLGLGLNTSPITVNASAESGDGALLGNVLTTALKTLDATPENLSELNTNINGILAKVVGVLNSADLSLASGVVDALPPVLQTLVGSTLTAPAEGSTAPILDLMVASSDGTSPPVNVDLLGLSVTTSNIEAHLTATTGEGQVLGNLLYNLANLADPGGPAGLLNLLNLLGTGALDDAGDIVGGSVSPDGSAPEELLTLTVKPIDISLLGLQVRTDPIIVTLSTQDGDGKLLGNLLEGITTLINVDGIGDALNNVLSTTVDLLNSASLSVGGVGSGSFDDATSETVTPVLDLFVAPVHLDLLGLLADTAPIHLTVTAHSGQGQVLGNVITELTDLFNPPLPDRLDINEVNDRLAQLIERLNQQIPDLAPAPTPEVQLDPGQFLELTVPMIDLNLLGLVLQTSPITVNATANTGNGLLLGNVLTTVLNTVDATTENLTGLNENLNILLAKVVGVLNASNIVLPTDALALLPNLLQTLAFPDLVTADPGATSQILDLVISSGDSGGPPIDVDLLGLNVSTSNIDAQLLAQTGDGQILGNLLYNVANLLNPGSSATLLSLLTQLGSLTLPVSRLLDLGDAISYTENAAASLLAEDAALVGYMTGTFNTGSLSIAISENADANDRLQILAQGTASGKIGVWGSSVLFGGKIIGTFSGGVGSSPLVISFNQNASPLAVQTLLQSITYRNLSNAPSTLSRTLTVSLVGKAGETAVVSSKTVTVIAENDAPVLNKDVVVSLTAIAEDNRNSWGTSVGQLLQGVWDADAGALRGIAITSAGDGSAGVWQYTLDNGATWTAFGNVSASAALLLPANGNLTRVRFVPKTDFNGTVKLGFYAWDQTQGTAGGTFDLSGPGKVAGTTAFSGNYRVSSLTVTPVNDAPALSLKTSGIGYTSNSPAVLLASLATVADVDNTNFAGGWLKVQITAGADDKDRLTIGGNFKVQDGELIWNNSVTIGTVQSEGKGSTALVINLNQNATQYRMEQLLRSIKFSTTGNAKTGQRSVSFSLSDGLAVSDPAEMLVQVS